tara:strand:+ start:115 stop:594 length:480 start_codon:yes stop_codon:yes gene_type:complete
MESDKTTPLTQLPNNSENDTDLVNKILNQLDESMPAESTPPTFENSQPSESNPQVPIPVAIAPYPSTFTNESMPSPQGIQNMISKLDTDRIYAAAKMSLFMAVMFLMFLTFRENFISLFSKLPFQTTKITGGLNGSGEFLQAICFGLVYFLSNMFLLRT